MIGGVLVVVSGLPGSGKSSLADAIAVELGAVVLSVDPIEAAIWRAGITPCFETGVAAYEVAAALAEQQLRLGLDVIADAVSSTEPARGMWRDVATRAGERLFVVEVICSDTDLHRQRLTGRERGIDGFPEPSWDEVLERQAEWEPWTEQRLVVDSVDDLDTSVTQVIEAFGQAGVNPSRAR